MNKRKSEFVLSRRFLFSIFFMGLISVNVGAVNGVSNPASKFAQTTGAISGRVTNDSGLGINKCVVQIQNLSGTFQAVYETDSGGYYSVADLPAGSYKLFFGLYDQMYLPEWYNDKNSFETADQVTVIEGSMTSNINASLTRGGQISGRVSNSAGEGIENIQVKARYEDGRQSFYTETGADGQYSITLLPAGTYKIHFDNLGLNYFSEWYNDKMSAETADPISVPEGGLSPNINAVLTKGGQISGRVTDMSGNGISQGLVTASFPDYSWAGNSQTDADGYYSISHLPSGNFKVYFEPIGIPGFVPEWYNDKTSFETADSVAVTIENTTSNIDAQLTATGRISGRISLSSGAGIEGIPVEAFDVDSQSVAGATVSDSNGDYDVENLPAGFYKLKYSDYRYFSEWYNDKASFQSADQIIVTSGETTENINAQLNKRTILDLTKDSFDFSATQNGSVTPAGSTILSNSGIGTLTWTATPMDDWISVSPASGAGNAVISIGISRTNLGVGTYYGSVRISDPIAWNSPRDIQVTYQVLNEGTDAVPFGAFDTPLEAATVASSIPVTGWALDDIGVVSVKIYRGTALPDRVYIGEAMFVEGARPDIANSYWDYPQRDRAGWGYMLLTNFLPNGGNGIFQLLAYATDTEGHEVLLGTKTIMCDNANAVKPFGTIDTPAQGGAISGSNYVNFGWALTPQPNSILLNGATINVWVDGLALGHPVYNNYRSDIAKLFPGYANSNGAVGYYYLDTTKYFNGMHTIAWSVSDSGGNMDGIGSRYFSIQNTGGGLGSDYNDMDEKALKQSANVSVSPQDKQHQSILSPNKTALRPNIEKRSIAEISAIPEDVRSIVFAKRGWGADEPAQTVVPETDGSIRITIPEVSRVAVYLNREVGDGSEAPARQDIRVRRISGEAKSAPQTSENSHYEAFELVGEELRPLPIGASFDTNNGAFYWQPGPGFLGEYIFIFLRTDAGVSVRKTVKISIIPKDGTIIN